MIFFHFAVYSHFLFFSIKGEKQSVEVVGSISHVLKTDEFRKIAKQTNLLVHHGRILRNKLITKTGSKKEGGIKYLS